MAINASKTKFIVFRTRGKVINPLDCHLVYNGNEIGKPVIPELVYPIERIHNEGLTSSFKLLGVSFDEYLTFDEHISHLCTKISKSLFCENRDKNFVDLKTRKMLYFAMVHSHIVYCINIYSCANTTGLNKLRVKKKEAIRIISNAGFSASLREFFGMLICCLYRNTILRQSRECLYSIFPVFGMKRELKKTTQTRIFTCEV